MMGMQTAPAQLFYDFCLDDQIPEGHLLRRILALQLLCWEMSESMGNHDSNVVGAGRVC
jgi:hypothetical protein